MDIGMICFTARGCETALAIRRALMEKRTAGEGIGEGADRAEIWCRKKGFTPPAGVEKLQGSLGDWTREQFDRRDALIFVGATGIAVRSIAPLLVAKTQDPAVLVVDELGRFAISLVSGHLGGANELCARVADGIGATAVITTATDLNHRFAVDVFAKKNDLWIESMAGAKMVSAKLLEGETVEFDSCLPVDGELPRGLVRPGEGQNSSWKITVSLAAPETDTAAPADGSAAGSLGGRLVLVPRAVVLGIGCRRGKTLEELEAFVLGALRKHGISLQAVKKVCSIDVKADERGILDFCEKYSLPFETFTAEELGKAEGDFQASGFVAGQVGVDNVCERSAALGSGGGSILIEKTAGSGMTVAAAMEYRRIRFE